MTLKDLLDTVLSDQLITLKRLIDMGDCEDQVLIKETVSSTIPYAIVAEFLDAEVLTVEAQITDQGVPYLYIEI